MTQLEYSMISSCCFVGYEDIAENKDCYSEKVLQLWNKIDNTAKEFAQWINRAEFLIYENGVAESNSKLFVSLEQCMEAQMGEEEYKKAKLAYTLRYMSMSFFEEGDDWSEERLVYQDKIGTEYNVDILKLKDCIIKEFPFLKDAFINFEKMEQGKKIKNVILQIDNKMKNLIMFRGSKQEIIAELNKIKIREESVVLQLEESQDSKEDFCYNTNLGKIGDCYIDYAVYMLPTNTKDIFLVTGVLKNYKEDILPL